MFLVQLILYLLNLISWVISTNHISYFKFNRKNFWHFCPWNKIFLYKKKLATSIASYSAVTTLMRVCIKNSFCATLFAATIFWKSDKAWPYENFNFKFRFWKILKKWFQNLMTLTVRVPVGEGTTAFYSCSLSRTSVDSGEAVISAVKTSVVSMVSTWIILIILTPTPADETRESILVWFIC